MFRLLCLSVAGAAALECYIDKDGSGSGAFCETTSMQETVVTREAGVTPTTPCESSTSHCVKVKYDDWYVGVGCEPKTGGTVALYSALLGPTSEVTACDTDKCNGPCSGDVAVMILLIIMGTLGCCCCCCCCIIMYLLFFRPKSQQIVVVQG